VQLLKLHVVQELPEGAHQTPVQSAVIFVFGLVNEVKVTTNKPRARAGCTYLSKLIKEKTFLIFRLWAIYTSAPPRFIT